MHTTSIFVSCLVLFAPACGGDDGATCGTGTILQDGECVVDPPPVTGVAPVLDGIDPAQGLVAGGEVFTLTGQNFRATDAGTTMVTFGAVTIDDAIVVSDSTIIGTIPAATTELSADIQISNDNGQDTLAYSYTGLYAADGKAATAGNLYLVDPRNGYTVTIGAVETSTPEAFPITGLAFGPDGTLYASESTQDGSTGGAHLLTIDPATGAATVVAEIQDDMFGEEGAVADLTFVGDTLYGYSRYQGSIATIDTTTAVQTLRGTAPTSHGSGLATLADGTMLFSPERAGGNLFTVDSAGDATVSVAIDYFDGDLDLNAMTVFRGEVFAVVSGHDGTPDTPAFLAAVDPTSGVLTTRGPLPTGIDALASDQLTAADARRPASPLAAPPAVDDSVLHASAGCPFQPSPGLDAIDGAVTLRSLVPAATGDLEVVSCSGHRVRISAAELANGQHQLKRNRRGQIKLTDPSSGRRRVVGNVIQLRSAGGLLSLGVASGR